MEPLDPALVTCRFINSYNTIWVKHFSECTLRAHWLIARHVRMRQKGMLFSSICTKMGDAFGMDHDTCLARVNELIVAELLKHEGPEEIDGSTLLVATPKLIETFDLHVIDAVYALYDAAKSIDPKAPRAPVLRPGRELTEQLILLFERFIAIWDRHREEYLEGIMSNPVSQKKAHQKLKTYSYWYIFLTAWQHRHPQEKDKRKYLLIGDFYAELFRSYKRISPKAITVYLKEMIQWHLLLPAKDVPRGQFAVLMSENAFQTFRRAFGEVAPLIASSARDIRNLESASAVRLRVVR